MGAVPSPLAAEGAGARLLGGRTVSAMPRPRVELAEELGKISAQYAAVTAMALRVLSNPKLSDEELIELFRKYQAEFDLLREREVAVNRQVTGM